MQWQWQPQNPAYGNYGNANQWTVNAGLTSLARESAQNSNDARLPGQPADLVYRFIRLRGERRRAFEEALQWDGRLRPHLEAMGSSAGGAVAAGQIRTGLEALRAAESLTLLAVSDYGCRGLTGPEFAMGDEDDFGNFIKLCRLDLFSGKDQAAGGSFGLGKAVYWRFSRVQTVLFNSTVAPGEGVGGRHRNRLFGVQQGVVHRYGDAGYQGRGYFGVAGSETEPVRSIWAEDELIASLHLGRDDERPGTTALLVGFYDPDNPHAGLDGRKDLESLAKELRSGIEENFWPLLTRRRMGVRIDVEEDGRVVSTEAVDGAETFTELVRALRKFDAGDISDTLDEPEAIVVRDVPIRVPARRDDPHPVFDHQAKLVVTMSDDNTDALENRVCLFRRAEMIVETLDQSFDGRTYHAFLLAGAAIRPDAPTQDELRADDFLRFSEPPAHDRWLPGTGRRQASQANLTARYVAPWVPNLRAIDTKVREALFDLFGTPPPPPDSPPQAVLKNLRFLSAGPGTGGSSTTAQRKPVVTILGGRPEGGRWHVEFQIRVTNRPAGWALAPRLGLVGLDGAVQVVDWDGPLELTSLDGALVGHRILIPHKSNARVVRVTARGRSSAALPIPADEAVVDVVLKAIGPASDAPEEER